MNFYVNWDVTKTAIFLREVARDSKGTLGGPVSNPWSVAGSHYIHLFEESILKPFKVPKKACSLTYIYLPNFFFYICLSGWVCAHSSLSACVAL